MSRTAGTLRILEPHSDGTVQHVRLARSGRTIVLHGDRDGERIVVFASSGEAEITIRITDQGPVVTLASATLELAATRDVTITCDRFAVEARSEVALTSGGDIRQRAEGTATLEAEGRAQLGGRSVSVTATLGNVDVRANDDVVVEGERIYLNR